MIQIYTQYFSYRQIYQELIHKTKTVKESIQAIA